VVIIATPFLFIERNIPMTIDEMNDQIDQLEHDMWVPITPTTEAEKIVAALNALTRS